MTSSDHIAPYTTNLSFITDNRLNIVYCNSNVYSSLALSSDELFGKHIFSLHELIDIKECLKVARTLAKNSLTLGRIAKRSSDGNVEEGIEWEVYAVYTSDKKVIGFWFTAIEDTGGIRTGLENINTKPQTDSRSGISKSDPDAEGLEYTLQLRKSEQQFRSLSENVPGAVYEFIYHKDGTSGFKYLSPTIIKLFGIPVEKFSGSLDHIVLEDKPQLLKAIKHSSDTNAPFYFEGRLKTADGRIKWHSASSSYSYTTENGARVFTGIIQDITERKAAEVEKEKFEAIFRLALAKVGDNVWEHNFQQNETFFSETIFDLIGYKPKDLKDNILLWWNSIHEDDRWMVEETDTMYKTGTLESHSLEYRVRHADGSTRWIRDRGVVIEWSDKNKPVRIIGTHTDITKEKESIENNLREERQKKNEILQAMLQAQESERQAIAYELHENVNQVLSSCYVLLDWMTASEMKDKSKLTEVKKNINLVINEIESITYSLSTSTLEMIGLKQALVELVSKLNTSSTLTIKLQPVSQKVDKIKDPEINLAIYRIIQEQIMNIIRNSGAKRINIKVGLDRSMIFTEVTDDRKSIDHGSDNNGVGMINILNRVESLNGLIEFNNKPGSGFRLRVAIPITGTTESFKK